MYFDGPVKIQSIGTPQQCGFACFNLWVILTRKGKTNIGQTGKLPALFRFPENQQGDPCGGTDLLEDIFPEHILHGRQLMPGNDP
jgi:hypothetical protein